MFQDFDVGVRVIVNPKALQYYQSESTLYELFLRLDNLSPLQIYSIHSDIYACKPYTKMKVLMFRGQLSQSFMIEEDTGRLWSASIGNEPPIFIREDYELYTIVNTPSIVNVPNNDGRLSCAWCNAPTKSVQGFSSCYNICTVCGK